MDQGQEQFFNFIMERVQSEKKAEAKELLNESFSKQADGTFDREYLKSFIPRMLVILKPENVEEVKNVMTQFGGQHQ